MTDITPKYDLLAYKEKVIPDDVEFGTRVGGLQANATSVQQGSGNSIFKVSEKGIHLGAAGFDDAPFSVNMAGELNATSGHFSGDITGATGTFSGTLVVGSLDIPDSTTEESFHVDISGNMWLGAATFAAAPFSVSNTGALVATSATINGSILAFNPFFGDGDNGTVIISSNTTLTDDVYYIDLTVNAGITLTLAGSRLFVKGTLTNNGTITASGNTGGAGGNGGNGTGGAGGIAGTAGSAGAAVAADYLNGGLAGSVGVTGGDGATPGAPGVAGNTGTTGSNISNSLGSNGKNGGNGGAGGNAGTPGGGGGNAGTGGIATASAVTPHNLTDLVLMRDFHTSTPTKFNSGAATGSGGGGGGGGSSGIGMNGGGGGGSGGGGSPGGIAVIAAKTIINAGTISVSGGVGGAGGNGGNGTPASGGGGGGGGGGGSGGGNGGILVLIYTSLTDTGTITVAGGVGGAKGSKGLNGGGTANDGSDGVVGVTGSAGRLYQLQL